MEALKMADNADLKGLGAAEILQPSYLESYAELRDVIWQELIRLNSYLFILDKLLNFPSDVFLAPGKGTFLALVKVALSENCLLIISKLASDIRKDSLRIERFKNWVRKHIKQQYIKSFDSSLKKNKFDNRFNKTLLERARAIRNHPIAHLTVDHNMQPQTQQDNISYQEISEICRQLSSLFDVLCFDVEYLKLPLDYNTAVQRPKGSDPRSDIEYFLDLIVQDSYLYKMPEESLYWRIDKKELPLEWIGILNRYRRKFGKPVV